MGMEIEVWMWTGRRCVWMGMGMDICVCVCVCRSRDSMLNENVSDHLLKAIVIRRILTLEANVASLSEKHLFRILKVFV